MIKKHVLRTAVAVVLAVAGGLLLLQSSGCYSHTARFDASRLSTTRPALASAIKTIPALKVTLPIPPSAWESAPLKQTMMYSRQEWFGPSHHTGLGVVYVHMPLPMAADALVWLARQQYTSRPDGGKMVNQWTDAAGRSWFETAGKDYHARGYIISAGSSAWIAYCDYRTQFAPQPAELSIAEKTLDALRPIMH